MLHRHYFVLLVCLTNPFLIEGNRYKKTKLKFGSINEVGVNRRPTFKLRDYKELLNYRNMQGVYDGVNLRPTFKSRSGKRFWSDQNNYMMEVIQPVGTIGQKIFKFEPRQTLNNNGKYKNKDNASSKICLLKPGQEYCYGEETVYVPRLPGSNSRRRQLQQPVKLLAAPQKVILENLNISTFLAFLFYRLLTCYLARVNFGVPAGFQT